MLPRVSFTLVCLLGLACATPPASTAPEPTGTRATRPNIILLLADDLRHDHLGYAGHPVVQTPAIDALARRGTRFDSAYVTTAICSVSRASILSGQYGRRHGIWGFDTNFSPEAFAKTYPAVLADAGYRTGFIGKWGVGPTAPVADRFDFWRGFDGQGTYHHRDADGDYLHLTRLIGRQIDTFLSASTVDGQRDVPWQLSVSFKAPHALDQGQTPAELFPADPAYAGLYAEADWPRPAAAAEQYHDHFPAEFGDGSVARRRWETRFSTPARYAASLAGYTGLVHGIDRVVADLTARLDSLGLADDTVIIFTSDHGLYLGEYGFAGKWYGSEPAIRIPLVIYDPRLGAGQTDAYALNIDLAPTILALAGERAPDVMQGRDLTPLLGPTSSPTSWRESFFYEHLWPASAYEAYPIPSTEGVVAHDYKYMRYFRGAAPGATGPLFEELYARGGGDPDELDNLAREGRAASAPGLDPWRARVDSLRLAFE